MPVIRPITTEEAAARDSSGSVRAVRRAVYDELFAPMRDTPRIVIELGEDDNRAEIKRELVRAAERAGRTLVFERTRGGNVLYAHNTPAMVQSELQIEEPVAPVVPVITNGRKPRKSVLK